MKPAVAKSTDSKGLEEVGRATLQVVHDLKNRLNGIKLYATFLRKRLEQEKNFQEERETVAKLIAGIDRAAGDMTALIRYAQPIELRRHPRVDLVKIIEDALREVEARRAGCKPIIEIEKSAFFGEFDATALAEAFRAISEEAIGRGRQISSLSLCVSRSDANHSPSALLEWRGAKVDVKSRLSFDNNVNVHCALAARIIEAHGGTVEYEAGIIRARLPLSE